MSVQKNSSAPVSTEEVAAPLSEDQLRSKIEGEFETKLALLEQQLSVLAQGQTNAAAATPARPKNNYDFGVNPFEKPEDKGDTVVHFLEDGFTIGSVVYYRGDEALLPEEVANYNTREQILAFGRLMYRLGPWDGDEYDVDDPNLSDKERAALIRANESRRRARN